MSGGEIVAALIGTGGLTVAVIAHVRQSRLHVRQSRLHRRLVSIEEARRAEETQDRNQARITVRLDRSVSGRFPRTTFVVINDGPEPAYRVRAHLRGQPFATCDGLLRQPDTGHVASLQPSTEYPYDVDLQFGCSAPYTYQVLWEDSRGSRELVGEIA